METLPRPDEALSSLPGAGIPADSQEPRAVRSWVWLYIGLYVVVPAAVIIGLLVPNKD